MTYFHALYEQEMYRPRRTRRYWLHGGPDSTEMTMSGLRPWGTSACVMVCGTRLNVPACIFCSCVPIRSMPSPATT